MPQVLKKMKKVPRTWSQALRPPLGTEAMLFTEALETVFLMGLDVAFSVSFSLSRPPSAFSASSMGASLTALASPSCDEFDVDGVNSFSGN